MVKHKVKEEKIKSSVRDKYRDIRKYFRTNFTQFECSLQNKSLGPQQSILFQEFRSATV